jgi:hypothetical protein
MRREWRASSVLFHMSTANYQTDRNCRRAFVSEFRSCRHSSPTKSRQAAPQPFFRGHSHSLLCLQGHLQPQLICLLTRNANNLVNSFAGRVRVCTRFAGDYSNDNRRIVRSIFWRSKRYQQHHSRKCGRGLSESSHSEGSDALFEALERLSSLGTNSGL